MEAAIGLLDQPAALVAGRDEILACNPAWQRVVHGTPAARGTHEPEHDLHMPAGVESLLATMWERAASDGGISLPSDPTNQDSEQGYLVSWNEFHTESEGRQLSVVLLHKAELPAPGPNSHTDNRDAAISHLLVRQTLIEEAERRRLGQFLHDVVSQDLMQIRSILSGEGPAPTGSSECMDMIDRVIKNIRTLTFDLSPPVLQDLGLRAALHWLGDHLTARFGTSIMFVEDGVEPRLTEKGKTIVYRAIRELTVNACKHAAGSEIMISCTTSPRGNRLTVRDTGPGFDPAGQQLDKDGTPCFGLASVQQQIASIGGIFEIVSSQDEGTRATIIIPAGRGEES
ncbi:MAG: hypothetical protein LAT64_09825 [Phycisphaerales bacterium]|nr:hypothetical protein [Planctomycetota bacterium]MCH8509047.1 hypothetical protein [Phycisphaerales bacterium]